MTDYNVNGMTEVVEKDKTINVYFERFDHNFVASLYYQKGGLTMSGETRPRSICFSVTPVKVEVSGGVRWRTIGAYTGTYKVLKEIGRFSKKQMQNFEYMFDDNDPTFHKLLMAVARKNNLQTEGDVV